MTGSVTEVLNSLRRGTDGAAEALVQHFLPMLRKHTAKYARDLRMSDEDDIAIATFYELCDSIEKSRFSDISDRTQLWKVLCMLAVRKANDFRKFEKAEKRGGSSTQRSLQDLKHQLKSLEELPHIQIEVLELSEHVLSQLENSQLKQVGRLKMSGHTNAEISEELSISIRTTQLMVAKISEKMVAAFQP